MSKLFFYTHFIIAFIGSITLHSQNNQIDMNVNLNAKDNLLIVEQRIVYRNQSNQILDSIVFHDWNNAFSDKNSNLGKRFIENYSNKFFFTSSKNRGLTLIQAISNDDNLLEWYRPDGELEQIVVKLKNPLLPSEDIDLHLLYQMKLPNDKFTKYGFSKETFNLKYWYITPVVFDNGWQYLKHYDLDDLYENPSDFSIVFQVPSDFNLFSNLETQKLSDSIFYLKGKSILNPEVVISKKTDFTSFKTDSIEVVTNLNFFEISDEVKRSLLNRQLLFIKDYLGAFAQKKILLNDIAYEKNPLYGFNQLPGFLRPFSDVFEWDIRMLQTLSKNYIDQSLLVHPRINAWLKEGLPQFLLMKYVEKYYPDKKLIGNISKIWGVKYYRIAELNFNDRYLLGYQYVANSNFDQALKMQIDSLTNYNRVVANRFKTALGLKYLEVYVGDTLLKNVLKLYFEKNNLKRYHEDIFQKELVQNSLVDVEWFFKDFLNSDKNFDFKILSLRKERDSITLKICNKNSMVPMLLYGFKNNKIASQYWLQQKDSLIKVPYRDEVFWSLNYQGILPETNLKNNWKTTLKGSLIQRLKIRLFTDVEDPYHHQLFLEPKIFYNYYDKLLIANSFKNITFLKKNFEYRITPSYSLYNNDLMGSYVFRYNKYLEDHKINSIGVGILGNYFHYKPQLAYRTFSTYAQVNFKRHNLRSVRTKRLTGYFTWINKDEDILSENINKIDSYNVLHINYVYNNPGLINNYLFNADVDVGNQFSKIYTEFKFRRLTNFNQQFEVRFFSGIFLYNKSQGDYFSFGVNKPNDYLYRYNYLGRSETKGFFSQQFIMNDGGFKSEMPVKFANQWMTSINTSIGLWKWIEFYMDIGLVKNQNTNVYFLHDKGIRLNFVNNYLELYFPLHSNNGWESALPHYEQRIRFVFTSNFNEIFSFFKRGVL